MLSLKRKWGFTLVEVVVAMLIVSLVAAGMLAVFVVGRRSIGMAGHEVQALDFAREAIDELKGRVGGYLWGDDYLDPTPTGGTYYPPGSPSGGLPPGDFRDTFGGVRTYTVDNVPAGIADGQERYKRVTVRVNWTEPQ